MRVLLSLLLVAVFALACCDGLITTKHHVGALNKRLQREQRQQQLRGVVSSSPAPVASDQWMTQVLDHFDGTNPTTWQQRFLVNDTVWNRRNGPVFLMLGGEGPISPAYVSGHFMINDYATEHGALIVALEHRFYGSSVPLNNSAVSNLRFLSSQQALADASTFHDYLNTLYSVPASVPWIVFGGSYSGSLSAWLRAKYPHQFAASFSASAPVKAALDFPEYFQVVARSVGPTCAAKIQRGYEAVQALLATPQGRTKLQTEFNTCTSIVTSDDISTFMSALSNSYCEVVQYNHDNTRSASAQTIEWMCGVIENIPDDLNAMVYFNNLYNNVTGGPTCTEVNYTQTIQDMQPTSDGRSWTFQTCTEFGYFQTAETSDQPFPASISLAWFLKQCADIFGIANLTPHISFTNQFYGSTSLVTSNTFFTNGNIDPWHILGITSYEVGLQQNTAIVYMNGTAHCADMYPARDVDVDGLKAARALQRQYLATWLSEAYSTSTVAVEAANVSPLA